MLLSLLGSSHGFSLTTVANSVFVQSSGILRVQDRVPTQEREWGVSRGGVLLLPPKHAQASTHLAHAQEKPNWYLLALTCSLITRCFHVVMGDT